MNVPTFATPSCSGRSFPRSPHSRQTGVALFISLVLLLVLTIIGVSSLQTTSLEQRMARNTHDSILAFQSAEIALREGEKFVRNNVSNTAVFTAAGTNGLWTGAQFGDVQRWETPGIWANGSTTSRPAAVTVTGVNNQPRFIIEHLATVLRQDALVTNQMGSSYNALANEIQVFRITARGVGGSANARVLLQSTFGAIIN